MAGSPNTTLIGFNIYEEIGVAIVNPLALCPEGCLSVWGHEYICDRSLYADDEDFSQRVLMKLYPVMSNPVIELKRFPEYRAKFRHLLFVMDEVAL
jgi:hypothetical protein